MDAKQIARYIDDGANYYLGLFGNAEHMEFTDNGFYSYVKPKEGEQGIQFVFDIRLENLSPEEQKDKTTEIKALNMPVLLLWNSLQLFLRSEDRDYQRLYATWQSRMHLMMVQR